MKNEFSLAPWTMEGFDAAPEIKPVVGGEIIYRASGGTSRKWGNCFFVPAIGSTPINHWTAELLERELNASLWGNDFAYLHRFSMNKVEGAKYKIGKVAQSGYAGVDKVPGKDGQVEGLAFHQRSWVTPSGIFKQVVFILEKDLPLSTLISHDLSIALAPGRYHRNHSRTWN